MTAASWSTASVCEPASGEIESGDRVIVRRAGDELLVAVVDALGHGPKAALVATQAQLFLESLPWPSALTSEEVIAGLAQALHMSRGAAAMVSIVRGAQLDGCGVGNVELRAVNASVPLLNF